MISKSHVFYKNTLYKNVHDENGQKIKNIVRIFHHENIFLLFFMNIFQMYLKPSRADLADLSYFIWQKHCGISKKSFLRKNQQRAIYLFYHY